MIKLFPKRVEWKPVRGSFGPAGRSAFRVLGLQATASQREVFDAAGSVRLALKLGVRKAFEGDVEWLGEVVRGESEVRDAVGRLSEPAQRARERLFWFHRQVSTRPAATVAELMRAVDSLLHGAAEAQGVSGNGHGAEGSAARLHDAALLALAGLAHLDPLLYEEGAWVRMFRLWACLCEGEAFWSLLVAADLKGEYEPAVTFGEAAELRASAPRLISRYVAEHARDAARRDDPRAALRAFRVLRGAGLPRALLQEYERESFGPLEDSLTGKIDEALYIPSYVTSGAALRNYSNQSWRRFCVLQPRLAEFVELSGADSFPVRRVFEHASAKLLRLAESFETAGRHVEPLYVCRRARALAPPDSEGLPDIEAKLRALGAVEGLEARTLEQYAASLQRELSEVRVPPRMFKDDRSGGTAPGGGTWRGSDSMGGLTSFLFWLVMVAAGVGLRACAGPSSGTGYHINLLPRGTMTPPNLNLNFNYNVTPLNLNLYRVEPPSAGRPRAGRGRRRAAQPEAVINAPPSTTTERARPSPTPRP